MVGPAAEISRRAGALHIVLLSVAGDDCWWDVALARGAYGAGRGT